MGGGSQNFLLLNRGEKGHWWERKNLTDKPRKKEKLRRLLSRERAKGGLVQSTVRGSLAHAETTTKERRRFSAALIGKKKRRRV